MYKYLNWEYSSLCETHERDIIIKNMCPDDGSAMNVHSAILLYWVRWKKVSLYVLGMDRVIDCQQK